MIYTRTHAETHAHTHMHTHFVYESHKVANILLLLAKYVWTMIKLLARSIAMWAKHEGRRKRRRRRRRRKRRRRSAELALCLRLLVANCFNRKPQFQSVSRSDPKRLDRAEPKRDAM